MKKPKNPTVLIIGDVMLDTYYFGAVHRVSPEAPVPVLDVTSLENRLGGAANVALNIQALGAVPILFSILQKDAAGTELLRLMKRHKLPINHLVLLKNKRTTVKTRLFDGEKQIARFDEEDCTPIDAETEEMLVIELEEILKIKKPDLILLQDYNKGLLTKYFIEQILERAKHKIPVYVDPKKDNFFAYKQVTLFKPNLKEFAEALGIYVDSHSVSALKQAAGMLQRKMHFKNLLVTLSDRGIFYCDEREQYGIVPSESIEVKDVSGAGDTVISAAAIAFAQGNDLETVAKLANKAAAEVCQKVGVVSVNSDKK